MADKFIFDGPNTCVRGREDAVIGGVFSFSIYELYSEWKRWCLQGDNLKYLPAFRTIGGDPIGAGQYVGFYLFLRNDIGWCGMPPDINPVIMMIDGSFFGESPNLPVMNMIPGNTTSLIINRSALTMGIEVGGSTGPTIGEIAAVVPTAAAIRQEIDANSIKLDEAISTRLAGADYVAPDNADIAAIKAKTDTLINADLSGVPAAVLAAAQASPIHSNTQKINDVTVAGTGTDLDPWGPA